MQVQKRVRIKVVSSRVTCAARVVARNGRSVYETNVHPGGFEAAARAAAKLWAENHGYEVIA